METLNETTPRAWVGCLGCYNGGSLNGSWKSGEDIGQVPDRCTRCGSDEFWVFDHENFAGVIEGECSPHEAAAAAAILEELESDDNREAIVAYAANNHLSLAKLSDWVDSFQDSYRGEWDNFEAFADDVFMNYGLDDQAHDSILRRYFNFEAWARDLEYDYDVLDAPAGGVFIFQNC